MTVGRPGRQAPALSQRERVGCGRNAQRRQPRPFRKARRTGVLDSVLSLPKDAGMTVGGATNAKRGGHTTARPRCFRPPDGRGPPEVARYFRFSSPGSVFLK